MKSFKIHLMENVPEKKWNRGMAAWKQTLLELLK